MRGATIAATLLFQTQVAGRELVQGHGHTLVVR